MKGHLDIVQVLLAKGAKAICNCTDKVSNFSYVFMGKVENVIW